MANMFLLYCMKNENEIITEDIARKRVFQLVGNMEWDNFNDPEYFFPQGIMRCIFTRSLTKGQCFGEIGLNIPRGRRTATVIA